MANPPKKSDREFKNASDVENVVKSLEDIEAIRAGDRAKIEDLFNGKRPYSPEEEKEFHIQINVNWQEGKRIMRDANAQVNSALLHTGILFDASLEKGPVDKRDEWGQIFTELIHKPIQRGKTGRRFYFLMKSRNASLCMHGIGVLFWTNGMKWLPRFVPIEDLLISTETYCDFTNLRYFAVNAYLTPGELMDMTEGDTVHPGWNKKMVDEIIESQRKIYSDGIPSTWRWQPSVMRQIHKENKGYYYSDAVPKIRCRWFFYQEADVPNKWYRVMILREAYGEAKPGKDFLFDGTDAPFADDVGEIIQVQYGDNNLVPTLKYHVVRGLGVDLYAPVETNNRLYCQFIQSVFESLLMYFRIQDPSDRDRLKQIVLTQYGILPEGLNIVKRDERHQIDPQLVEQAIGILKNNMQESASSYIQTQGESGKEMTAKEATIKLNQATVMVSSMLQSLYLQEGFFYDELVRRFCKKGSTDPDVKEFQKTCIERGIPEEFVNDHTVWRVVPERVLGGGDRSLAQQEAAWLWQSKEQFDPAVQPTLKRMVVRTMLNDSAKANMLVPESKVESTNGTMAAENVFGTLMNGQQVAPRKGIDQIGYTETLIRMMASVIQQIKQVDNMGTPQQLAGLMTVAQNIGQSMAIIGQDEKERQRVKQYGDIVGKLMNELKGFAQRLGQKRQAEAEAKMQDPAAAAKAKTTVALAQNKMQIANAMAQMKLKHGNMKMQHDELAFQMDQRRKQIETLGDVQRDQIKQHHDIFHDSMNSTVQAIRTLNAPEKNGNSD